MWPPKLGRLVRHRRTLGASELHTLRLTDCAGRPVLPLSAVGHGAASDHFHRWSYLLTLTSKQRAELRAEAHHLTPSVHVGQNGVTPALVQSLDDALRARELVKIQLGRDSGLDPRELAGQLAGESRADVVQVIGKTATLYRENPDLPRREGKAPPWRR